MVNARKSSAVHDKARTDAKKVMLYIIYIIRYIYIYISYIVLERYRAYELRSASKAIDSNLYY